MVAIAEGLAVVLSQTLTREAGTRKVVIFSDCQAALMRVNELRRRTYDEEYLSREVQVHSVLRKLITRSQYFRKLGIFIELEVTGGNKEDRFV